MPPSILSQPKLCAIRCESCKFRPSAPSRPTTFTSLKSISIMPDAEQQFVDLIFCASKKYASWDPEVIAEVGNYGRITRGKMGLAFWRKRQYFLEERKYLEERFSEEIRHSYSSRTQRRLDRRHILDHLKECEGSWPFCRHFIVG